MCNVIRCKQVYFNTKTTTTDIGHVIREYQVLTNVNGVLESTAVTKFRKPRWLESVTRDFLTVLPFQNHVFYVNDLMYLSSILTVIMVSGCIIVVILTVFFIYNTISEHRAKVIEHKMLTISMTTALQSSLTESIKHELTTPLIIITTIVDNLYAKLYPKYVGMNGKCVFPEPDDTVCDDDIPLGGRDVDIVARGYYKELTLTVERISNVLDLIAGAKAIKYNNGTVSLYEIIKNIIDSSNSHSVNKIAVTYENVDLLKRYATGDGISNGDLLNSLAALVKNSLEAYASKIRISASINSTESRADMINLFVQDNGGGIKQDGVILATTDIFNYRYTTKNPDGSYKRLRPCWWRRIFKRIGWVGEINETTRGVGLSLNKRILQQGGGDLELQSTSVRGTVFKITIPIKKKQSK